MSEIIPMTSRPAPNGDSTRLLASLIGAIADCANRATVELLDRAYEPHCLGSEQLIRLEVGRGWEAFARECRRMEKTILAAEQMLREARDEQEPTP